MPKKIGLIGGLAFRAGVFYYKQLVHRHGPGLELVLNHADVATALAYVTAGDKAGLGAYLGRLANELADSGCGIVAITAVAPHLAISEIAGTARVPMVNVLDAIPAGLDAAGLDRVAVFGNRVVMQTNVFGAVPDRMAVELDPAAIDLVHSTYSQIALEGKRGTQPEVKVLSGLAHDLARIHGIQAILLAGTDLSSFYADQKPDFPFLDVAHLHIDQIIKLAAG